MAGSLPVAAQGSVLTVNNSEEKRALSRKAHGKTGWLCLGLTSTIWALKRAQERVPGPHAWAGRALFLYHSKHMSHPVQIPQRTEGCWAEKSHAFLVDIWVRLCGRQVIVRGNCLRGGTET